eukprot:GFUD01004109.1.p1 GENE.GFUD01004109.1~~GFUD01004109.1.p1  ORF type:complete len:247 (+),score=90.30 GFUD01004109.1:1786-2526(+)
MRLQTSKWNDYVLLRDEALRNIPDNIDMFSIKREFRTMITSKRRFERINTLGQLIEELERQLIIFPDKRGIQQFYTALLSVNNLQPQAIGSSLLTKVADLTKKLQPPEPLRSRNASTSSNFCQDPALVFNRVPNNIRDMLAIDLERCGGKDWEHFAVGLGHGLKQRERIRIRQGEVDHIERLKNGDIRQILDIVLTKFEDRCMQRGVNINMLDHLIDILKKEEIFGTPLNMLANKIKKEKQKLENS